MPVFTYSARSATGEVRSGEVEFASRQELIGFLRRQRLVPVAVHQKPRELALSIGSGIRTKEIVVLMRQFATLIDAGLPLVQSLSILAEQTENHRLGGVLRGVLYDIESGHTLADALRKYPRIFSELVVNMVAAGEAAGNLDSILDRLAHLLEKQDAIKRKVLGAMTYPAVMLLVTIGATTILLWQVVPIFAGIFTDAGLPLPLATTVVLALSEFLQGYTIHLMLGLILTALLVKRYSSTPHGRLNLDRGLLRMPLIGPLLRKTAISRFTRTLSTLLASGVPILEGLEITARTAGNRVIHDAVLQSRASIASGATIAEPLRQSAAFPPMVVQMIHVGEQTGGLDTMLAKIADFYDDEVDTSVAALTSVIEPLLVIFMGIVIGGLVVAMYLPMFDMIQVMQSAGQ